MDEPTHPPPHDRLPCRDARTPRVDGRSPPALVVLALAVVGAVALVAAAAFVDPQATSNTRQLKRSALGAPRSATSIAFGVPADTNPRPHAAAVGRA